MRLSGRLGPLRACPTSSTSSEYGFESDGDGREAVASPRELLRRLSHPGSGLHPDPMFASQIGITAENAGTLCIWPVVEIAACGFIPDLLA
jgi:hypothetical protein